MLTEQYCSYEVSKLLKEKGMDKEYFTYYIQKNNTDGTSEAVTTCTHQMAMRYLREVHDIETYVEYSIPDDAYNYTIIVKDVTNGFTIIHSEDTYKAYEKATNELLKYCLENLI